MTKKIISILLTICILLTLTACGSKKDGEYYVYYLSIDKTSLVSEIYKPEASATDKLVDELIEKLSTQPDNSTDCTRTIPSNVQVTDRTIDGNALYLYFNNTYSTLGTIEETLIRTAITRTLLQIPDITSVTFYVGDSPLTDSEGNLVGAMTDDSFLDYLGENTDSLKRTTLKLYYASYDGLALVTEDREVYYNSNVAQERLVIDYLMKKPEQENLKSPIPSGVKLDNINVDDEGLCTVTFDSGILTATSEVSEQVMVYAIVNSLTELDGISSVTIQVDTGNAVNDISTTNSYVGKIYTNDQSLVIDNSEAEDEEVTAESPDA